MLFIVIEGVHEICVDHVGRLVCMLSKLDQLDFSMLFPYDDMMFNYAAGYGKKGCDNLRELDFMDYGNRVELQRKSKVKGLLAVQFFSYDHEDYRLHSDDCASSIKPDIIFYLGVPPPSFITFATENKLPYSIITLDKKEEEGVPTISTYQREEERKILPSLEMHAVLQELIPTSSRVVVNNRRLRLYRQQQMEKKKDKSAAEEGEGEEEESPV